MLELYFDGGCKPNPGKMEVAVTVTGSNKYLYEKIGMGTNNEAEWIALLLTVDHAISLNAKDVTIRGDSKLIINQAKHEWKCKDTKLKKYLDEYDRLATYFDTITLEHVLRDENPAGMLIETLNK